MTLKHRLEWYNSPEGAREYLEEYEKVHRKLSDRRERRLLDGFFARTGRLQSVLDLPSGWGRYHPYLLEHCGQVVQADYSGEMLALGAALRPDLPVLGRLRASGAAIPLAGAAVDLVFSMRLNHHIADPVQRREHLREVFRVARRFAIFSYFDAATWKNRARQARIRMGGRKRPKSTLRLAEVRTLAAEAGFELTATPLLFLLGSGHRLVLATRLAAGQGPR